MDEEVLEFGTYPGPSWEDAVAIASLLAGGAVVACANLAIAATVGLAVHFAVARVFSEWAAISPRPLVVRVRATRATVEGWLGHPPLPRRRSFDLAELTIGRRRAPARPVRGAGEPRTHWPEVVLHIGAETLAIPGFYSDEDADELERALLAHAARARERHGDGAREVPYTLVRLGREARPEDRR